jgi:nucleoside-diphosphate-sugar epimerase
MRVFVTGASGFVGSAVTSELLAAGHQVLGLARSDSSARALEAAGAQVHVGDLEDMASLRAGAESADGVIHLAFKHDFADYAGAAELDRRAIHTLGDVLTGTDRPLVVTSGLAGFGLGRTMTEDDAASPESPRFSEHAALEFASRGVRASVLRLPPSVHGEGDHGFVPRLIDIAREKSVAAYPGDGTNRWPSVHRLDAARLFRLALESAPAGARLHAIDDEGVPVRDIAAAIGRHLGVSVASVPAENALDHFGWLGTFFSLDVPASSVHTRALLGWQPTQVGLLDDLDEGHYFGERAAALLSETD